MRRNVTATWCLLACLTTLGTVLAAEKKAEKKADKKPAVTEEKTETTEEKAVAEVFKFKMKKLDGKAADLSAYQGKVVLFVNVASQCGLTPQYKELEAIHEKYAEEGLAIIGVPANDFGAQEPGTDEEIAKFCKDNYDVSFDMLSKVTVKGDKKCDLYKYLTAQETEWNSKGEVQWNFEKFLISREGKVVGRFSPRMKPDAKEIVEAIEAELKK